MNLMLDTHILLWTLTEDIKLPSEAVNLINSRENQIFYSIISVWETAIKHIKNPKNLTVSHDELVEFCIRSKFKSVPLLVKHVDELTNIRSDKHHDPFDRILIAQAKAEGMRFLTHDDLLTSYEEPCVIVV